MNKTRRNYTPDELARLHTELYDILGETIRVCEQNNLRYFLIGGTAIGALYDNGILPWDDDIDIGMPRKDYEQFLKLAPTCLKSQYFLSCVETDPKTPYYFAKVRKNGTLFKEETFSEIKMHQGIFIDIFPFDKIPQNKQLRAIHRGVVNFLKCCLLGKEIWLWRYCGTPAIENPSKRGFLPCLLNKIVDVVVPKIIIYKVMKGVQGAFNSGASPYYNNVVTKTDVILESEINNGVEVLFGNLKAKVPQHLEGFLRRNYPQLHRFTPEEQAKISNHCPLVLQFSDTKKPLTE